MMETRLIFTWVCNLADTVSTLYLFGMGYTEANPVMNWLLRQPPLFALVKISAISAVLFVLWKNRADKKAVIASWFAAILYGVIAIYYCIFFMFLI